MMSDTGTSAVICNIGDEKATCPISGERNLQRLVYDVAVAATECNPTLTQAHSVGRVVIKCRCMEAPLCGERISSGSLGTQPSG